MPPVHMWAYCIPSFDSAYYSQVYDAGVANPIINVHSGNVGIVLPTVNHHSQMISCNTSALQCDIIVPSTELPESVQALPPYLVHYISTTDYILEKDTNFVEGPLQTQLLDPGNG